MTANERYAAGIVAYQSDKDRLVWLIDQISPYVERVIVFVNDARGAPVPDAVKARVVNTCWIESSENVGVAAALNALCREARRSGCQAIWLFDQDASPSPAGIEKVAASRMALLAASRSASAVAPRLTAPAEGAYKAPRYWRRVGVPECAGCTPVMFVPTSGTLLDLQCLSAVGEFREDFFIDGIDIEWCSRAWSAGGAVWVAPTAFPHTIGQGAVDIPGLGAVMPRQPPFRMYTFARNAIYAMRLAHVPWHWKLRQIAYLPVQSLLAIIDHGSLKMAKAIARGVVDGCRGRLGPIPRDLAPRV
jgi:rhamnosyltransferase